MDFVSAVEFSEKVAEEKEKSKVFNWAKLEIGKIFKVLKIETYFSAKFNHTYHIVTLADIQGVVLKVWGSAKLADRLTTKSPNQIPYLTSLGQEPIAGNKTVNAFDLYLQESDQVYTIIDGT